MSPLRSFSLFVVTLSGDTIFLKNTASFYDFGAVRSGQRYIRHLTKLRRLELNISKSARVIAHEYLGDGD
jgi:hypothetical protein